MFGRVVRSCLAMLGGRGVLVRLLIHTRLCHKCELAEPLLQSPCARRCV